MPDTPLNPLLADALTSGLKVAVVHDWLVTYAGAERVLDSILDIVPDADIYTLVDHLPEQDRAFLRGKVPKTSFIQRLPFSRRRFRHYLPLFPLAIQQFDLSDYDLVISSSYAVAKGVLTGPDQVHVCYCHSPIRYAWDLQSAYLRESGLDKGLASWVIRWFLYKIRIWDVTSATQVDRFLTNSAFTARRIQKYYGREATVVYPPVDTKRFRLRQDKEDFFLTVSRLVPYKHVATIVTAFQALPEHTLVVIGDGPEGNRVRALAKDCPNIRILGQQPDSVVQDHMRRARAFIFAAKEDFGIVPLEAQACGTPVIAFAGGGSLETVVPRETAGARATGLHFDRQTSDAVRDAVLRFDHGAPFAAEACRDHANHFTEQHFQVEFASQLTAALAEHPRWQTLATRHGTKIMESEAAPETIKETEEARESPGASPRVLSYPLRP